MRVMFWPAVFWPYIGGVQTMAGSLLVALREHGHEFIVITERGTQDLPSEDEYEGIPVYRLPFAAVLEDVDQLMKIRKQVIRLKREFAADLLHTNAVSANDFFHLTTQAAHPAPWLVTLHGAWPSSCETFVRRTLASADWVVGCSEAILEQGRRTVPAIRQNSSVIYNALQVPCLPPEPLPFDPPRLLYLGRLSPEKRVDLALDALVLVVSRHPSAQLVIAGDGPERERLELQTTGLGLRDHVQFLGWVDSSDVPTLVNSATLVLLSSEQEAFGLSALEAALMARPVVAPRRGGLPEVVEHGSTGLLVDELDAVSLAEAVAWLLEHPESASRMGKAARTRARKAFNWRDCVDAYDALYEKIVKARDKSPLEEPYV